MTYWHTNCWHTGILIVDDTMTIISSFSYDHNITYRNTITQWASIIPSHNELHDIIILRSVIPSHNELVIMNQNVMMWWYYFHIKWAHNQLPRICPLVERENYESYVKITYLVLCHITKITHWFTEKITKVTWKLRKLRKLR